MCQGGGCIKGWVCVKGWVLCQGLGTVSGGRYSVRGESDTIDGVTSFSCTTSSLTNKS